MGRLIGWEQRILNADCYDNGNPAASVEPDKIVVDPVTFNVSIYFASAQTGTLHDHGLGRGDLLRRERCGDGIATGRPGDWC